MTDSDDDLQQMYDALRRVDESLAPSFDELLAGHRPASPRKESPPVPRPRRGAWWIAGGTLAATVLVLTVWLPIQPEVAPQPRPEPAARITAELEQLHDLCDSLQETIERMDPATMPDSSMPWPDVTASLSPFDPIAFPSENRSPT